MSSAQSFRFYRPDIRKVRNTNYRLVLTGSFDTSAMVDVSRSRPLYDRSHISVITSKLHSQRHTLLGQVNEEQT